MHFCVLSLLATVTLLHRVLFWLFVNYVNTLIATRHLQRAEGRVLTSRLRIFPPCQGEASDLLLTEWANSSQGVLEPKRGEEMVQKQSECQALSPIKNILKLCGTIRQCRIHQVLSIPSPNSWILSASICLVAIFLLWAPIIWNPNYCKSLLKVSLNYFLLPTPSNPFSTLWSRWSS